MDPIGFFRILADLKVKKSDFSIISKQKKIIQHVPHDLSEDEYAALKEEENLEISVYN